MNKTKKTILPKKEKLPPKKKSFSWKQPKTWPIAPLATLGPLGYFPKGPGTIGALAALPIAYLASTTSIYLLWLITLACIALGLLAIAQFTENSKEKDPGCVIVDEVAGQLVAFGAIIPQLMHWDMLLLGFVLFRVFDIFKFGSVAYWDRQKNPLGVMMDDITAGVFAGFILAIIQALSLSYF